MVVLSAGLARVGGGRISEPPAQLCPLKVGLRPAQLLICYQHSSAFPGMSDGICSLLSLAFFTKRNVEIHSIARINGHSFFMAE